MPDNLYQKSIAAEKINQNPFIGFIDIDGSFVYEKPSQEPEWQREFIARKKIRDIIQAHGVLASITMRTPAMMLTESSYRQAIMHGYTEPEPLLGFDDEGKRAWQSQETLEEFAHVLDWDIVSGIGSGILVKTSSGYSFDTKYINSLGVSPTWREDTLALLKAIDKADDILSTLASIESEENYKNKLVNIYPRPYRIQLDFRGPEGLIMKQEVARRVLELRRKGPQDLRNFAREVVFLDESNPEEESYTLYLIPKRGTKERAMDHILKSVCSTAGVSTKEMNVLYAGDTMTDFKAGFVGGIDADVTFILVGGSRMMPYLLGDKKGKPFAGESLAWIKRRLTNEVAPGVFTFTGPLGQERTVVIGDIAYPGTKGPETIAAWLEDNVKNLPKKP